MRKRVGKKGSGSAPQKGSSSKGKRQSFEFTDDTKLVLLKDKAMRKVAAGKSKAGKSIMKIKGKFSMEKISNYGAEAKISEGDNVSKEETLNGNEENIKASLKWKRGADGEIVRAYLSSANRGLSRFRTRKEVPSFQRVNLIKGDSYKIVGKRVKVYWSGSRRWYIGRITAFNRRKKLHSILYEDGDKEELDLSKERFELEIMPSEGFNLTVKTKSPEKAAASASVEFSTETLEQECIEVGDDKNVSVRTKMAKKRALMEMVTENESPELKSDEAKTKEGKSVSAMYVKTHPKSTKLLDNELLVAKKPVKIVSVNKHDVSVTIAEMSKAAKPTVVVESRTGSGVKNTKLGENDGGNLKSGESVKEISNRIDNIKPVKMHAGLRKKARSSTTKRRRRLQLPNSEVRPQRERLDEVMDADERQNETEKASMQNEIHVKASLMNQSEDTGVQATKSDLDADNLVYLIGINSSGVADAKVDLQNETQVAAEEAGNIPTNVEIAVLSAVKVQEKVRSQEIDLEYSGVDFSENHDNATKSRLEVCSEKSSEVFPDLNSTTLKNPK